MQYVTTAALVRALSNEELQIAALLQNDLTRSVNGKGLHFNLSPGRRDLDSVKWGKRDI